MSMLNHRFSNEWYAGLYLGLFLWGEVGPEKIFQPRGGEKKFFRPSRGSGGMLPRKSLKI